MSAGACIIYFGLRYEVAKHEIEALEERSDARVRAARKVGLKVYWGNFSDAEPRYVLFIGSEIAKLGPENAFETTCGREDLTSIMDRTVARLAEAGLEGESKLYIQWQPDL